MQERGFGRISFMTSASALFGNFGQASYAAAKMGLAGLAMTAAIEGARYGIQTYTIAPLARTPMADRLFGGARHSIRSRGPDGAVPRVRVLPPDARDLLGRGAPVRARRRRGNARPGHRRRAYARGRARISRRDLRRKRSRPAGERSSCGTRSSDTAAESSTTGTHCDAELASLRSWGRPSHSRPQDPATCRPTSERHYDCRADPGRPGRPQGERLTGKHPRSRVADQWATTVSGPSRPISGSGITTLVLRRRPAPFIAYWAPAPPSACLRMFCS